MKHEGTITNPRDIATKRYVDNVNNENIKKSLQIPKTTETNQVALDADGHMWYKCVDITQVTGTSTTAVMSQTAVTNTINQTVGNINSLLETI